MSLWVSVSCSAAMGGMTTNIALWAIAHHEPHIAIMAAIILLAYVGQCMNLIVGKR